MLGLEVLGLIIGVFPVVIQGLKQFDGRRVPEFRALLRSVKNDETIFLCTLESLLSPQELTQLLDAPSGKEWLDPTLETALRESLGDERVFQSFKDNIQEIKECLVQLQKDVSSVDSQNPTKGYPLKTILKLLHKRAKTYERGVNQLHRNVEQLRSLLHIGNNAMYLKRTYQQPRPRRSSREHRDYFRSAYIALSRGWTCDCPIHHANLRLERPRPGLITPRERSRSPRRCRLSFSMTSTSDETPKSQWLDVELESISTSTEEERSSTESLSTLERRQALQSSPIDQTDSQLGHVDTGSDETQVETPNNSASLIDIKDLCLSLSCHKLQSSQDREMVGTIRDEQHGRFGLYILRKQSEIEDGPTFSKLTSLIGSSKHLTSRATNGILERPDRLRMALTLAFAVSQLYSTPWLDDSWTRTDVLCLNRSQDHSDNAAVQVYVSKSFSPEANGKVAKETNPNMAESTTRNDDCQWIRNPTLHHLALLLIELCLNKSIEDLLLSDGRSSMDPAIFTAQCLRLVQSDALQGEYGSRYQEAVRECFVTAMSSKLVDEDAHQKFETDVLKKLKETCRFFGVI